MYNEDEYLMISGIQHYVFCRRQWALIHIEQQWAENFRTVDGSITHQNVHDNTFNEKRKDIIITRGMAVSSPRLGVTGECDVVEFHLCESGVEIFGRKGKYIVVPVEYKRGEPKEDDCDILQLTTQAMCIEDMLCCNIEYGYLFYGETRRRVKVTFDQTLRERTEKIINEMHNLYFKHYTPKVKRTKSCNACSLKDLCLPILCGNTSATEYINRMLNIGE